MQRGQQPSHRVWVEPGIGASFPSPADLALGSRAYARGHLGNVAEGWGVRWASQRLDGDFFYGFLDRDSGKEPRTKKRALGETPNRRGLLVPC